MKMDKEMMYEVPEVQVLAVSVEKGFEGSGTGETLPDNPGAWEGGD